MGTPEQGFLNGILKFSVSFGGVRKHWRLWAKNWVHTGAFCEERTTALFRFFREIHALLPQSGSLFLHGWALGSSMNLLPWLVSQSCVSDTPGTKPARYPDSPLPLVPPPFPFLPLASTFAYLDSENLTLYSVSLNTVSFVWSDDKMKTI